MESGNPICHSQVSPVSYHSVADGRKLLPAELAHRHGSHHGSMAQTY